MGRRTWTAKEKVEIVLAGMMPNANISAICRDHKIFQSQYYKWRDAFLQGGQAALSSQVCGKEQELEKELKEAKTLLGEQAMQIEVLRKKTDWGRR